MADNMQESGKAVKPKKSGFRCPAFSVPAKGSDIQNVKKPGNLSKKTDEDTGLKNGKPKVEKSEVKKEKIEKLGKKDIQKRDKKETLPVKSLTDKEYEDIFEAAIENALALNMEEWEPKITPPVKVGEPIKKKYSITVGKKASEKCQLSSLQSSEASCTKTLDKNRQDVEHKMDLGLDEEANEEKPEEAEDDVQFREQHEKKSRLKHEEEAVNDQPELENREQGEENREIVDENNNNVEDREDAGEEDEDVIVDVVDNDELPVLEEESAQHKNETTPAVSEADSSENQLAPIKKKKTQPKSGKKTKLEPKQLSFDAKKETSMFDRVKEMKKAKKEKKEKTTEQSKKRSPDCNVKPGKEKKLKLKSSEVKGTDSSEVMKKPDTPLENKTKPETADKRSRDKTKGHNSTELKRKDDVKEHKVNKRKKMLDRDLDLNGTWVQCCNSTCMKWRYLPDVNDPGKIPERWTCSMNPNKEYSVCSAPEEEYDESEHIYTKFTEGSVVWARITGYPWWPAMVETDPDVDTYFSIDSDDSMIPTHYHVVFFDEKVSRAWVTADHVTHFTGNEEEDEILYQCTKKAAAFKKEIAVAKKYAMQALQCTIVERIKQFGFATRYKGPWNIIKEKRKDKMSKVKSAGRFKVHTGVDDYLDDSTMDEVLDNTDALLDNVEEMLDSVDSELDNCDEDSYGSSPQFVKPQAKCRKPAQSESDVKQKQKYGLKKSTANCKLNEHGSVQSVANTGDSNEGKSKKSKTKETQSTLKLDSDIFTMEMDSDYKDNLERKTTNNIETEPKKKAKKHDPKETKKHKDKKTSGKKEKVSNVENNLTDDLDVVEEVIAENKSLEKDIRSKSADEFAKTADKLSEPGHSLEDEFDILANYDDSENKEMSEATLARDVNKNDEFDLLGKADVEHSEEMQGLNGQEDENEPVGIDTQNIKKADEKLEETVTSDEKLGKSDSLVPDVCNQEEPEKDREASQSLDGGTSQGVDAESDTEFDLQEHYMYETFTDGSGKVRERATAPVPVVEVEEDSDPFDLMEE